VPKVAHGTDMVNSLSAMVTLWHPIIVGLKVLAQKGLISTLISWVKCSSYVITMAKGVFWWVDVGTFVLEGTSSPYVRHPPILASQEQLALQGLKDAWMLNSPTTQTKALTTSCVVRLVLKVGSGIPLYFYCHLYSNKIDLNKCKLQLLLFVLAKCLEWFIFGNRTFQYDCPI
jgi:hypothetical protein